MGLIVKDIEKFFGEKHVLKGINFEINPGEALGILGRNGTGKTTLFRILLGVIEEYSGEISFDDTTGALKHEHVGYLAEERGLYPKKTVQAQLTYFAKLHNVPADEIKERINYWLKKLEVSEYLNSNVGTLSKGNQQKIQLIATVLHDPKILILDEPFSGLDPINAEIFKQIISEEAEKGKIILFSCHEMHYIEEFCKNIMILNKGKVVFRNTLDEAKKEYGKWFVSLSGKDLSLAAKDVKFNLYYKQQQKHIYELDDETSAKSFAKELIDSNLDLEVTISRAPLSAIYKKYTESEVK